MSTENQENTKRIAKNTLFMYFRMILVMIVSLYTSRIMLEALGAEDYGLNNVVGGIITLFTFLNSTMATTSTRFLSYELGNGNVDNIKKTFSNSFITNVFLSLIVLILGESIGVIVVNNVLVIPENRLFACNVVFQTVIFSALFSIIQTPFSALQLSNENMSVYAYLGIFDAVAKLVICFIVKYASSDKLIVLSLLHCFITMLVFLFNVLYTKFKFSNYVYITKKVDFLVLKSMISFASWNMMGSIANMLKNQGINILINLFFGSVVNAANAIAYRINSAVIGFTSNFTMALNPQIVKSYSSGELESMKNLIYKGGRYTFFLLMILGFPLMLEINFVLKIWLGDNVPNYTSIMAILVLVLSMVETFTYSIGCAVQATGKIKYYQLVVSGLSLLNFPISYLLYKMGFPPYTALVVSIILSMIMLFSRLFFMKSLLKIEPLDYIKNVFAKTFGIAGICLFPALVPCYLMSDNIIRFFVVCIIATVSNILGIYFMGLSNKEKAFVVSKIHKLFDKLS